MNSAKSSQCQRVMDYLEVHGRITPFEALSELGVYRLGARIFDLKQRGEPINSRSVTVTNRFGEPCRVAEYRLAAE